MKQNIVIAIIVIIALALGALYVLGDGDIFAGLSGIFEDDQPVIEGTTPIDYTNFDLWMLLCHISGKTLDQQITYDYINRLNMKPSGSMLDYSAIYEEFSLHYTNEGFTYEAHMFYTFADGAGAMLFLTRGAQGAMLLTATTGAIQTQTGYNTLSITSTGPLYVYHSFYAFVEES